MTESLINVVFSTSERGEISSNRQISPNVEMTRILNLSLVEIVNGVEKPCLLPDNQALFQYSGCFLQV